MRNVDLWIIKSVDGWLDSKSIYTEILNNYVPCISSDFDYNEYGKPFLKSNSQIFFNVSHNSNIMVVAVTTECEIGIDLELKRRNIINPLLIANKFFHKLEIEELNGSDDLLGTFMQMWVIKEAFVKMKGTGISYGFNMFHVDIRQSRILDCNGTYSYNIIDIESIAICVLVPHFKKVNIRYF